MEAWTAYVQDCKATDELLPRVLGMNAGGVTVLTADHGELFGHMGSYALPSQSEHGHGLSDSPMEIHVPLGIMGPGFEPGVDDRVVSLLDVRSTLLAIAGIESSGGDLRTGEGLTPAVSAACDVYDRQTSSLSVRVRDDGSHVLRTSGLSDVPELGLWRPEQTGLRPVESIGRDQLDEAEQRLLFRDAFLPCVSDRDLCKEHPELQSLGYIECP
jgi:hypothetical protein